MIRHGPRGDDILAQRGPSSFHDPSVSRGLIDFLYESPPALAIDLRHDSGSVRPLADGDASGRTGRVGLEPRFPRVRCRLEPDHRDGVSGSVPVRGESGLVLDEESKRKSQPAN